MDEHQHDEDENIEKKMDINHIFNSILAKTRNLLLWKQKQFGFLVNQSESAIHFSSKTTWFRRIYFYKKHHIINSCTNMSNIYGNKDEKSYTTWIFPSYRKNEIQWSLTQL